MNETCSHYGCNEPAKHRELVEADGTGRKVWLNFCERHAKPPAVEIQIIAKEPA